MFPTKSDMESCQGTPVDDSVLGTPATDSQIIESLYREFRHRFTRFAVVRFDREGFHRWPDASEHRFYLADCHRHLFKFEIKISVEHAEREIEFHDLLHFSKGFVDAISVDEKAGVPDFGTKSCETIGEEMVCSLMSMYGSHRSISVSVFEDGEVGAIISNFQE